MKAKNILLIFFLLSASFHILFFSKINITLTKKQNPQINAWPNILKTGELSRLPKIAQLPKEINFSTDKIRKNYFSQLFSLSDYKNVSDKDIDNYSKSKKILKQLSNNNKNVYFLWNNKNNSTAEEQSTSYQAFVSPYGKIVLFYPQKLGLDSDKNINSNNYLKESLYFFNEKFFWTNIDVLVK